jgi:Tfp pilus assembly protein PilO
MTKLFDKINLRPQERRLVVFVGMIIFVLLNMWFIWPYFDDWGELKGQIAQNRATLGRYEREIANRPKYEALQKELESTGSEMLESEMELQRLVQQQMAASGIQRNQMTPVKGQGVRTNQFFQEAGVSLTFTAGGKELVDFLVGIAQQNQMVRVRDMTLRRDPTQTKLGGNIIFVGNYQKPVTNAPARSVAVAQPAR